MNKVNARELLHKYKSGNCTEQELAILEKWYKDLEVLPVSAISEAEMEHDLNQVYATLPVRDQPLRSIKLWPRIAAAASIIICLITGSYFLWRKPFNPQIANNQTLNIPPGSNKAILTLSGGEQIVLNDARNGKIARQGNAAIIKTNDGAIVYHASRAGTTSLNAPLEYNTITVPRGGQYHLTLTDGTQVWLNAASSIKYPTVFSGHDRHVEISGEAYFEVASDKTKPFTVSSDRQTVEVLGTHFNINTYKDEPAIRTTLLAGAVKVSSLNSNAVIKPGQQAIIGNNGRIVINSSIDTSEIIAWKREMFQFNETDIGTLMRQISRWYNIDVTFDGKVPEGLFHGKISRNVNISQVLKILELSGIRFKIVGGAIMVIQ